MQQHIKIFLITILGTVLLIAVPSAAEAQYQDLSPKEKSEKLFNWAELLATDVFIPLNSETRYFLGIHYRHYPSNDIMLATFEDEFFYIHGEDIHYLGEVDYWLNYKENNVTGSFYGNVLESALEGLVDAAQGELDDEVLGLVLSLLGWGDEGNEQDHKLLENMDQELDEIINILQAISGELENLEKMLQIEEEEILADVNDPTSSITQINTFQDELQNLNKDKKPGGVSTDKILDFAAKVEDNYQIENDVNAIHDAILPPTIVKSPVLNNLTDLCINRVSKGQNLTDAYHMLELYFSQLLYNQLKGVNLVVEAKLAREKSGYYEKGTAEHYMDDYKTKILPPQVENFQKNVWRLILSQVDLINATTFLPSQAGNILARADFFVAQVLAEEAGIRGYIISTTDLLDDAPHLAAVFHEEASSDSQGGNWIDPKSVKMNTASGKPYDHWQDNRVSRVSDYYVISYDFGNQDPGQYDIYLTNDPENIHLKTSSMVNKYNQDYQKDSQGDINYGSFVIANRVGAKEAFDQNVEWRWYEQNMKHSSSMGSASSRYVGVDGSNSNDEYSGLTKLHAYFVYVGEKSVPINFHYHTRVRGSTSSSSNTNAGGFARSRIYYSAGVADSHTGDFLHHDVGAKGTGDNGSASLHHTVATQFTFRNPTPGREYFIYFNAEISGDSYYGSAKGNIKLDNIKGNQYISF